MFKQTDGMAMGSPLGPTFANIFMCHLEDLFLQQCPCSFKPVFYKRYVDDTFVLFKDRSHAELFLNFINSFHPNIKFTMDIESENQLSFLDILITRDNNSFTTGVHRKGTFTGLGMNFLSFGPLNFKLNSCRTLLHRAYNLCSSQALFDKEISFLSNYFKGNCYPPQIFANVKRKFLATISSPKVPNYDVPKKVMYVSLPYIGNISTNIRK